MIRIINNFIVSIFDILSCTFNNNIKQNVYCYLQSMQDDGFIKSFDLQVSENSILITIPEMFKMNVDRSEKIFSIEKYGHIESICTDFNMGIVQKQ